MTTDALLRVTGPATEGNSVPAEVLVRAIQGVQQSVWLLAAATESGVFRQRFKPDQSFRQRFTLRVSAAQPGSYAMPMSLVDERPQTEIDTFVGDDVLVRFAEVWRAIADDDLPRVRSIMKDEGYFVRLMQELRRLLPRRGERWGISFGAGAHADVELAVRHRPVVERWLENPGEQRETSIIGELRRIDFAVKRVWVLYPPTQREIECSYRDEVEDSIVDARRGLFQVTGQFVLDVEGHSKQLTDVRSIEPVDLSPVELAEIEADGTRLLLDPPLLITPHLDPDEEQHFVASIDELGLTLGGRTRDALFEDLAEQLSFVWREYALAAEDELTEDAQELRRKLLARVREG